MTSLELYRLHKGGNELPPQPVGFQLLRFFAQIGRAIAGT